ncbi:MAG: hypothetical protein WDA27_10075 [Actinomycetota bacterium]
MKRVVIFVATLALALPACAQDHSIGSGVSGGSTTLPSSAAPTTSKSPTKRATPTATKSSARPVTPTSEPNKFTIVVRSVNEGYLPRELRACVGDLITFTNQDPSYEHSWSADESGGRPGPWKSPMLAQGKSWTWTIDAAPGEYKWHDDKVPYLVGGPLEVLGKC